MEAASGTTQAKRHVHVHGCAADYTYVVTIRIYVSASITVEGCVPAAYTHLYVRSSGITHTARNFVVRPADTHRRANGLATDEMSLGCARPHCICCHKKGNCHMNMTSESLGY